VNTEYSLNCLNPEFTVFTEFCLYFNMRLIGIDPGFARVGYAVIDQIGGQQKLVDYGCLETKKDLSLSRRLLLIADGLRDLIKKYQPQLAAVEKLFFFKNLKTAIDVAQARGAILLTLEEAKLPIVELTPLQVKQALTGYGRADKQQLARLLQLILKLPAKIKQDDASDAVAIALAGLSYQQPSR